MDCRVPTLGLLLNDEGQKPENWREQLNQWLRAGGVALVAWGFHARALAENTDTGEIVCIDPSSASKQDLHLDDLPEGVFRSHILIPPQPGKATKEMLELLSEIREIFQGDGGVSDLSARMSLRGVYSLPASLKIIDRMLEQPPMARVKKADIINRQLLPVRLPSVQHEVNDKDGLSNTVIVTPNSSPPRRIVVKLPPKVRIVGEDSPIKISPKPPQPKVRIDGEDTNQDPPIKISPKPPQPKVRIDGEDTNQVPPIKISPEPPQPKVRIDSKDIDESPPIKVTVDN
jgi:hypothetical protein